MFVHFVILLWFYILVEFNGNINVNSFHVDESKFPFSQGIDCIELLKVCMHKVSNTITSFDTSYLQTGIIPEWIQWGLHVPYHDNDNKPRHMRTKLWSRHKNHSFAYSTPVTNIRVTHQNGDKFYGGSRHYPLNTRLATVFDTPYEPFRNTTHGLLIVSEWLENPCHSMYSLSAMAKAFEKGIFSGNDADVIFASGDGGPILNFTFLTWDILPHQNFIPWDNVCYEKAHLCRVNSNSLDRISQENLWATSQAVIIHHKLNNPNPKYSPLVKTQIVTIAIRENIGIGKAVERGWLNAHEILSYCNFELASNLTVTASEVMRFTSQKHDDDSTRPSQMPLQATLGNTVFLCQTHVFGKNQTHDIQVAQATDILVGVHGAALVHSLFMREGSHLLEIISKHAPDFVDMHYRAYLIVQGYHVRFWRILVDSDSLIVPSLFEKKRIGNKVMWGRDNSLSITNASFEVALRAIFEADTAPSPLEKFNSMAIEKKNIFIC